jgi:NADH:ubiquinone oxidoreductase subunit 3 (subunit A)
MYLVGRIVILFMLVGLLLGCFHLFLWNFEFGGGGSTRSWASPFECGFLSQRLVENYFRYSYFILLVFFVVFDLEVSLLLNMPLQGLLFKKFSYYLFFLVLLAVGFRVEINKGYVEWGY